ncbi:MULTISPECIES: hypothetical protein [Curtobacterium]|jgi:hypothetical protein|uniref:Uncharacterized protein n=1 Tax=Curtobacterium poinsettiae TaxID=159612 RepID=A0ABT3S4I7_9MICO|nr:MULTISPECIES: hypothetical protein [Curtobacterium]EYT62562.1 hypothetical protein H489_0113300 [Curtobacterium flaccumfaciens UCD-AKU]KIQ10242.1 hypothetical protein RU06_05970 [Curtobacterium flaccumfaciens]KQR32955.1 hypothetical protein ASF75_06310 [Curtobacterium sp. Leaf154]MBF4596463.1 hypothetical protein [Curtobacterium sp. VKM Ac-1796]MBF4611580.1 hypothetical protein [Curtobacterium sp. VKM Ac-2889]
MCDIVGIRTDDMPGSNREPVALRLVPTRVTLVERFDDEADLQRVSLVLAAPVVGTLYRYEGAFRYEIAPDTERG